MPATMTAVPSLTRLLADTRERQDATEPFANENPRTVRIEVDGSVWMTPGAAVAYRGALQFERRQTLAARSVGDAVVRETAPLVKASGRGRLYCGQRGSHARIVRLQDERLVVTWHSLLAFESSLSFETALVGGAIGLAAGGLIAVTLSGSGVVALATHGDPLTLPVSSGSSVNTDPRATLGWSASLTPRLKFVLTWRSIFGHGGQEPVQMSFDGTGSVLVQPFEVPRHFDLRPHPLQQITKLVSA